MYLKNFSKASTFLIFVIMLMSVRQSTAQDDQFDRNWRQPPPDRPIGLTVNESDQIHDGYILAQLIQSKEVLLIARDGRIVNKWVGDEFLGTSAYLTETGTLIRSVSIPEESFQRGGQFGFTGGRFEEITWDGEVLWSFEYINENYIPHHDMEILPNGNIIFLAFDKHSEEDALAKGFNPENLDDDPREVWSEHIVEFNPITQEIVWEWYVWDHIVQEFDDTLSNYGIVAENPHLINANYVHTTLDPDADWLHANGIDYNPIRDEIVISLRHYNEIWIIDHKTTTEEAAGSAGDLLYRWGNPLTYNVEGRRELFFQHNPEWIPEGYPGAGNMTIFENGGDDRNHSRVVEISLPLDEDNNYIMKANEPTTGQGNIVWVFQEELFWEFFSLLISSTERQANGNTLIDEGMYGRIFEINQDEEIVWEYYLPPSTWVFKANFYDYPILAELDEGQALEFLGGDIWETICEDGSTKRLYSYNFNNYSVYNDYIGEYGDNAETQWVLDACIPEEETAETE